MYLCLSNLDFEAIDLPRGDPEAGASLTRVLQRGACSKCAIDQFERLVAVHCSQQGVRQLWLILQDIQAWRTRIAHKPLFGVLLQYIANLPVYAVENTEINIVCVAELLHKTLPVRDLRIISSATYL